MPHTPDRVVLVTGASRGLGAEVAQQLADAGTHVIVNYRKNAANAESIAQAVRDAGGSASTLAADICDEASATAMIETIATRYGRLDTVILNVSGGGDIGADPAYAMRLNRDAQRRLALLTVPLMPAGARFVFVTNDQAHFFPHKAVPKGYAAVAASKRAGETALYALRPEFSRAGIRLTVVSGDMIERVDEFATAIVTAATTPNPSGTVYVRGTDYLMTA